MKKKKKLKPKIRGEPVKKIRRKTIKNKIFLILIIVLFTFIHNMEKKSSKVVSNSVVEVSNNESENITSVKPLFPNKVYGVPVYTELIESNTKARPGTKRIIKYIVIHETDNFGNGVGAKNHAIFLKENNTTSTSWHYTVDDLEIYHHIPDNEIANHAGEREGNNYGIGVELCVNKDGNFEKTFKNGAKLVAYLLKGYNLTIKDVKTHKDFSRKDCPHSILKQNRMKEFKRKVLEYYNS